MFIFRCIGKKEWLLSVAALVSIVTQVFLDLKLPDYMQEITRLIVTPGAEVHDVLEHGGKMLACALGSMCAAVVTAFCMSLIGATLAKNLRREVFDKAMDFSMAEQNKFSLPSLITRSTNDVTQIQMFVVMGLQMAVKSPILAVWASIKIAGKNVTWTVATVVAVAIMMMVLGILLRLVVPRMMRMQRITDDLNRVTREHLSGLRVIRAYNSQTFHRQRFEATNKELTHNATYVNNAIAFLSPFLSSLMAGLTLTIYALGAMMINNTPAPEERLLLFSQMLVFSAYAIQIVIAFTLFAVVFIFLPRARVSYRRIREVLTTDVSIVDGLTRAAPSHERAQSPIPTQRTNDLSSKAVIEFNNVTFRYPDADDDALHGISFTARRGETVALIGATGSGKTSIVNLIGRFFDVSDGQVLVCGVDVRDWKQSDLRDRIAYVPQKSTLFTGTVASNIAFGTGLREITPEDIVDAAHVSSSSEFILDKEDGYSSRVSQGGSNFSGGQKQRLSIARAVARHADIMIFDDSFSALDFATDRAVRAALHEYASAATKLIVAQRIGTVRNADRILVIDHGRIVGSGTHDELIESDEVYREIALSQLSEEELS